MSARSRGRRDPTSCSSTRRDDLLDQLVGDRRRRGAGAATPARSRRPARPVRQRAAPRTRRRAAAAAAASAQRGAERRRRHRRRRQAAAAAAAGARRICAVGAIGRALGGIRLESALRSIAARIGRGASAVRRRRPNGSGAPCAGDIAVRATCSRAPGRTRRARRGIGGRRRTARTFGGQVGERRVEPVEVVVELDSARPLRCTGVDGDGRRRDAAASPAAACSIGRQRRPRPRRGRASSSLTRPMTSCGSNGFASTPSQPASVARPGRPARTRRSAARRECAPAAASA